MADISKSPERNTFQKEVYVRRCEENGEEPNQDYLDMYQNMIDNEEHKFDDQESRKNNLEYDLLTTDWILEKVRTNDAYAQNLYAALCNNEFQKLEVIPILKEERWSCSWRHAGGIIADMQEKGDYINWYCSGIRNVDYDDEQNDKWYGRNIVAESVVTDEIRNDLKDLGWIVVFDSNEI